MVVPVTACSQCVLLRLAPTGGPASSERCNPLSLYRGSQQDIRLLSEATDKNRDKGKSAQVDSGCLYLGGSVRQEVAQAIERRLSGMDIKFQPLPKDLPEYAGYWVRVVPESRRLLDDSQLQTFLKNSMS